MSLGRFKCIAPGWSGRWGASAVGRGAGTAGTNSSAPGSSGTPGILRDFLHTALAWQPAGRAPPVTNKD